MNNEKKDFDKTAASWDANAGRVKLSGDIAESIKSTLNLNRKMDVMDFGCGTGLVTLRLAPLVRSITAVDSSQGMLDVLKTKIAEQQIPNVRTQFVDLDQGQTLEGQYDLVYSSMTFHHVKEVKELLAQFLAVLRKPGMLCVADLDLDEGKFHADNEGVFHFGFDRAALRDAMLEVGFVDVQDGTAATMVKPQPEGGERAFTIFLITAKTSV